MKVIKISQMVLRAAFVLALILGLCFWANLIQPTQAFRGIHMLLGILVVLSLWIIGLAQGTTKGGNFVLALVTFAVGLAVAIVGMWQDSWRASINITLLNTIHLLLGLIAVGLGEMIAGRTKRLAKAQA